jgi:hypothetical protein
MKIFTSHINQKLAISLIAYILISFMSFKAKSQNDWTWIKGTDLLSQKGIYGIKNIPSSNNTPGGRVGSINWTDLNGDLWLYGGNGQDSISLSGGLSDLWKFDIALKKWIWISGSPFSYQGTNNEGRSVYGVQGIPNSSNSPGYRTGSATWVDNSGDLWLFGGSTGDTLGGGSGSSFKNDLWKYNIASGMWTWVKGSKYWNSTAIYGTQGLQSAINNPGARSLGMISWKDVNGNFWLFGGEGITASTTNGVLNDLWKYDLVTNQWAWQKGSSNINSAGSYGTIGVSNLTNNPSAREEAFNWLDKSGNLWLYGGFGYDASSNYGDLSDLWKYNLTTNQWVWVKGTNIKNQLPIYGSMNTPVASNRPGAMGIGGCWVDSIGNLWLGNSYGTNQVATDFYVNIMWRYNILSNQWTWTKGPNILANQAGNYGIQGTSAITNIPGGRTYPSSWSTNGEFWLFGGFGAGSDLSAYGQLNDLWRFIPCYTATVTPTNASVSQTICSGSSAALSANGNGTITWYNINSTVLATGNNFTTPTLTTNTTFLVNDNVSCLPISITVTVNPTPTITISASSTVVCQSNSVTLNALSGAFTYTWNNGSNATSIVVNPTITTTYTVFASNYPTGCTNSALKTISVNPLPTINTITNNTMLCVGQIATITASGANTYTWNTGMNGISITVSPTTSTTYTVNGTDSNGCKNSSIITQSVHVCTGIELLNEPTNIYIYPNPTNELVNIDLDLLNLKNTEFELVNTLGEILISKNIYTQHSSMIMTELPVGMYFIRIIQDHRLINYSKIIKEN